MFQKRMEGPTVWADWNFNLGPRFLQGFGVEAEVRVLDFGQPRGQKLRQATLGGEPIYTWRLAPLPQVPTLLQVSGGLREHGPYSD
jgi:hypothetical protein